MTIKLTKEEKLTLLNRLKKELESHGLESITTYFLCWFIDPKSILVAPEFSELATRIGYQSLMTQYRTRYCADLLSSLGILETHLNEFVDPEKFFTERYIHQRCSSAPFNNFKEGYTNSTETRYRIVCRTIEKLETSDVPLI